MLYDFSILLTYIDCFEKRQRMSPTKRFHPRNVVGKLNVVKKHEKRLCNAIGEFRCRGRFSQDGCKFNHVINPYESNEKLKTFRM